MLGVFVVGFFLRGVRATPAFVGTLVAQAVVVATFAGTGISYLWYNVIGCVVMIGCAGGAEAFVRWRERLPATTG
jgi:hypothetical protein